MSILTIEEAMQHLRVNDSAATNDILEKLAAAEDHAMQFLNRNVYKLESELMAAKVQAEIQIPLIHEAYSSTMQRASLMDYQFGRRALEDSASAAQAEQMARVRRTFAAIVINPSIRAAILLILGHLFENREDVTAAAAFELPNGAKSLLWPYRVEIGV